MARHLRTLLSVLALATVPGLAAVPATATPASASVAPVAPVAASAPSLAALTPVAPGPVTAYVVSPNQVQLSWTRSSTSTVVAYTVRRSTTAAPTTPNAGTLVATFNGTTVTDSGLSAGTRYYYSVFARDASGGTSAASSATATTWLFPSILFTGTRTGSTVALHWQIPPNSGITQVVVRRAAGYLDNPTTASGTLLTTTNATSYTDTLPDPMVQVTYVAYAVDSAGRAGHLETFVTQEDLPVSSVNVTTIKGRPQGISCATSTWCLSVDKTNHWQTFNGTAWSAPQRVPGLTGTPYCPYAGWCVIRGADAAFLFRNGTVTSFPRPPLSGSIACVSATMCVNVGDWRWSRFDGTRWSSPVRVGTVSGLTWTDVDCQWSARCQAVGVYAPTGSSWRAAFDGTTWTVAALGGAGTDVREISCGTMVSCVAVGLHGTSWSGSRLSWTYRGMVSPLSITLRTSDRLSCASATLCVVLDESGAARRDPATAAGYRWNGTTWSTSGDLVGAVTLDPYTVSCAKGGTRCLLADEQGTWYTRTASTAWVRMGVFDPTTWSLTTVACATRTECYAGDLFGSVSSGSGAAWGAPAKLFVGRAVLTCAPGGPCLGVDTVSGITRVVRAGAWSGPIWAPIPLVDVACGSATFCLATDGHGRYFRFNGTAWSAPMTPFTAVGGGRLDCPTATLCVTARAGKIATFNGSSWSSVAAYPTGFGALAGLSCPSATLCLLVDQAGGTARYDGTRVAFLYRGYGGENLGGLTCPDSGYCLAWYAYGATSALVWNSRYWQWNTLSPAVTPTGNWDCPALRTCVAPSGTGVIRLGA